MGCLERWFRIWRASLGVLGALLLLVVISELVDGQGFAWFTFAVAAANVASAYFGFERRPRLAIALAALCTLLALPLLVWGVFWAFVNYVVSTGNWNFGAVH